MSSHNCQTISRNPTSGLYCKYQIVACCRRLPVQTIPATSILVTFNP